LRVQQRACPDPRATCESEILPDTIICGVPRITLAALLAGASIVCENRAQLDSRTFLASLRDGDSPISPATSRAVLDRTAVDVRHWYAALLRGSAPIVAHAKIRWRSKIHCVRVFR